MDPFLVSFQLRVKIPAVVWLPLITALRLVDASCLIEQHCLSCRSTLRLVEMHFCLLDMQLLHVACRTRVCVCIVCLVLQRLPCRTALRHVVLQRLSCRIDWLQSLKHFFTNVSYHILVTRLTLMALFLETEPSE